MRGVRSSQQQQQQQQPGTGNNINGTLVENPSNGVPVPSNDIGKAGIDNTCSPRFIPIFICFQPSFR